MIYPYRCSERYDMFLRTLTAPVRLLHRGWLAYDRTLIRRPLLMSLYEGVCGAGAWLLAVWLVERYAPRNLTGGTVFDSRYVLAAIIAVIVTVLTYVGLRKLGTMTPALQLTGSWTSLALVLLTRWGAAMIGHTAYLPRDNWASVWLLGLALYLVIFTFVVRLVLPAFFPSQIQYHPYAR